MRDGAEALKVAEQWIDSIDTGRFFLFLHLPGPSGKAGYDARVAAADELVGQLVAFLKKRGLYNGGVIVLTSGHGVGLGDHGEEGHGLSLYEPVVRVPLIVKLPRRDGGGRHSAALVQHIDIAPTMLDLVGAPRPSKLRRAFAPERARLADRDDPAAPGLRGVVRATAPLRLERGRSRSPTSAIATSSRRGPSSTTSSRTRANGTTCPRRRPPRSNRCAPRWRPLPADVPVPQPAAPPDAERERLAQMGYLAVDGIPPAADRWT